MKNVLFATTAIVAASFAGTAFADISLSGAGELGITYNEANDEDINDGFDFVQDFKVDITATGTSDSGLTFGGTAEIDSATNEPGDASNSFDDVSTFVSGSFGTLSLGAIDSAYDFVSVGIATGGLDDEADYYFSDAGGDGVNDNTIARYDYVFGSVTFSVSVEQGVVFGAEDDLEISNVGVVAEGDLDGVEADDIISVGLGYSGDLGGFELDAGLGYQMHSIGDTDIDIIGLSVGTGFGAVGVNLFYEIIDIDGVDDDLETIAASIDYTAGALTIGANYVNNSFGDDDVDSYGLFTEYDLGGGLSAVAAVSQQDIGDESNVRAGFGLAMAF